LHIDCIFYWLAACPATKFWEVNTFELQQKVKNKAFQKKKVVSQFLA